ncbi:MAG: hypothetical protein HQK49_10900 [Oligoflexia bacterium]|nr:hypothetical protein [Oligoflexia bacterium]
MIIQMKLQFKKIIETTTQEKNAFKSKNFNLYVINTKLLGRSRNDVLNK